MCQRRCQGTREMTPERRKPPCQGMAPFSLNMSVQVLKNGKSLKHNTNIRKKTRTWAETLLSKNIQNFLAAKHDPNHERGSSGAETEKLSKPEQRRLRWNPYLAFLAGASNERVAPVRFLLPKEDIRKTQEEQIRRVALTKKKSGRFFLETNLFFGRKR